MRDLPDNCVISDFIKGEADAQTQATSTQDSQIDGM